MVWVGMYTSLIYKIRWRKSVFARTSLALNEWQIKGIMRNLYSSSRSCHPMYVFSSKLPYLLPITSNYPDRSVDNLLPRLLFLFPPTLNTLQSILRARMRPFQPRFSVLPACSSTSTRVFRRNQTRHQFLSGARLPS